MTYSKKVKNVVFEKIAFIYAVVVSLTLNNESDNGVL